jgi:hypothetical protein
MFATNLFFHLLIMNLLKHRILDIQWITIHLCHTSAQFLINIH